MMVITSRIVVRELILRRSLATAWGISAASRRYGMPPCFLAGHAHGLVSQTWKAFSSPRTSGQRARARVRSRSTGSGWSS